MKADHNTITPFDVKVMWKYKVLSKRKRCVKKMVIYKQEVTFLLLITWQEMVTLLANNKSHNNIFKMNIKFQNMCQILSIGFEYLSVQ